MNLEKAVRIGAITVFLSIVGTSVAFAGEHDPNPNANNNATQKVTICHRTNSITNPYEMKTVDAASVDGDDANDNGNGGGNGDHLLNHTGPVFNPLVHTHNGDDWGDIIPDIDTEGHYYASLRTSLNWPSGKAIWDNKCSVPVSSDTDEDDDNNDDDTDVVVVNPGQGGSNPTPAVNPTPSMIITPLTPIPSGVVLGAGSVAATTELPKTGSGLNALLVAFAAAAVAGVASSRRSLKW